MLTRKPGKENHTTKKMQASTSLRALDREPTPDEVNEFISSIQARINEEQVLKIDNPKTFGWILWYVIHTAALQAKTPEQIQAFANFMQMLSISLPCIKCRGHCQEYLRQHPILTNTNYYYQPTGEHIGCFLWSWNFHNAVNARIHKPLIPFRLAYRGFSTLQNANAAACGAGCQQSK